MNESRRWFWLVLGAVTGGLLYLLGPVLTPFLAAALLAYMGSPLVDRLQRWRLSRTLAVALVFSVLTLLVMVVLAVLVPQVERQWTSLLGKLPLWLDWVQQTALPWLQTRFGIDVAPDMEAVRQYLRDNWRTAGGLMTGLLKALTRSGASLMGWLAMVLLIPVVAFYLLRDWHDLVARGRALLPRDLEPIVVRLAREADGVLGAFFRGQLLVMLTLGMVYTLGLALMGLDFALLIGMLAGLVSFVPYLGFVVGLASAVVVALMQFQDAIHLLYVALVFGVGQMLEGMVLQPLLLGERIGLHPVAVIFAVLVGGQLFGFFGVLLALPAAAVIVVLLRYAYERYRASDVYQGGG